jgi:hypothetical protein
MRPAVASWLLPSRTKVNKATGALHKLKRLKTILDYLIFTALARDGWGNKLK